MGYLIKNDRTVYTLSSDNPLYVYSQTDKQLIQISKVEPEQSSKYGVIDTFKNVFGDKFSVSKTLNEEQTAQVTQDPQSLIVNLELGENCLIAGKNENGVDGGFLVSTFPELSSGEYYGPSFSGLPNMVVNFFANKYGETDVEALREQLTQSEGTDLTTQTGLEVLDLSNEGAKLPQFNIPEPPEMGQ